MGRAALDEDAIRLIEEHNPDVDFDWTKILKGQGGPEPMPSYAERRARGSSDEGAAAATEESLPLGPDQPEARSQPTVSERQPSSLVDTDAVGADALDGREEAQEVSVAHRRLGAEGVLRLRARYAEILTRISERISDPIRQEALKSDAERLNPDTWVTDDEVRDGLERYETVFESLRTVIGQRRRPRRASPATETEPPAADDASNE